MPNFVSNTITINGEIQIAAAIAKKQLVITRVQVGAGVATGALPPLTALVAPVMNCTPIPPQVSANLLQPGEVVVMAVLDAANVTSSFQLTELGVFATSAGGPEQLIAYCACSAPYDTISPGTGSSRLILNLQIPIVVGPGASVSITVQAGNPVYVPPVVAGPGIVVTAPTNAQGQIIEWIVSTPQITQNTILHVANEYTQNQAPYFSSLANAMDYLGSFSIASGVGVSINMAAESFNSATATIVNHVNASQITIQGANNPDVTFNGIGSITGSAGNWKVQLLNVSSTANITVGMWLDIWYVNWNWSSPLVGGCFQVTAVAGSTVTIQTYYYASSWPSMAGVSGQMTPLTTIMYTTDSKGTYGIVIQNGIGLMKYIAVVNLSGESNNYTAAGVLLNKGTGTFLRMAVFGWRSNTTLCAGFYIGSSSVGIFQCCSSSFNDNGFIISAGDSLYCGCCSSHNLTRGIWADANANLSFCVGLYNNSNFTAGNRERGVLATNSSYVSVNLAYVNGQLINASMMSSYNNGYGFHFINQSRSAFSTSTSVFWAAFNITYDVAANQLSCVSGQAYIQGTRNFNGTPGVLIPGDGSLFI